MTSLYNCRHSGDQYRITKFTSDFDVEASYLVDAEACECPAGHRPHCRHREMLPKFITRGHIGDEWFFDHDRGGWVQGAAIIEEMAEVVPQALSTPAPKPPLASEASAIEAQPLPIPPLPDGITFVSMEDGPEAVYNAIADAVGEPRIEAQPKTVAVGTIRRRV